MCIPTDQQRIIENMLDVVLEDWEVDENPIETESLATDMDEENDDEATDSEEGYEDESIPPPPPTEEDWEQRFYMQRNSAATMTNIIKASMRYMRVDIEKLHHEEATPTTTAMRYRLEYMERVVEAFEESDYFTLYRLTPRRLFE